MYCEALGFSVLATFKDHDGFDGTIVGRPGDPYHLEFTTRHGYAAPEAPDADNLLVFYVPDATEWEEYSSRLLRAGFRRVDALNPFWERAGRTFADLDGYRVVIQNSDWPH